MKSTRKLVLSYLDRIFYNNGGFVIYKKYYIIINNQD
jgi:hypothetical protein